MVSPHEPLPKRVSELQQLVADQRQLIDAQQCKLDQEHQRGNKQQRLIDQLHAQLRALQQQRFARSSEKHAGQVELQFFNEAELTQLEAVLTDPPTTAVGDAVAVAAHTRKPKRSHALPAELPRVEVIHDLEEADKVCACGEPLSLIGYETLEQLSVIPQQYYVIQHKKCKYACSCKVGVQTANMPTQPLPASQASPQLVAQTMVAKYHDGLPLYRQEKIAARDDLELPRAKLARWLIGGSEVFQPVWNLLQDAFFSHDIAWADETGIQVLKEEGRAPENKSYLWIRRGGPPDKPVVLVDYSPSRSGETAYSLLDDFTGYLICDGYTGYNKAIKRNGLTPVFCNDHARRKFMDILKSLGKSKTKGDKKPDAGTEDWVATKAVAFYKTLYRLEKTINRLSAEDKHVRRQEQAVPAWNAFIAWAKEVQTLGVAHKDTRVALNYLIKHEVGLRRYCEDGRLPISNILAEHVAKAIAVPRKNFLFADTPAGADASARIYSVLETAKANGHHPQRYLSVLLTELPNASTIEQVEGLLPWNLSVEEVNRRYASYPAP